MSGSGRESYQFVQDKDILLSEEGRPQAATSAAKGPAWRRAALGLVSVGVVAVVGVVALRSSSGAGSKADLTAAPSLYETAPVRATQYDPYAAVPQAAAAAPVAPAFQAAVAAAPAAAAPAAVATGGACGKAGEDCSSSQCCLEPGFQCFTKNADFATCRAVCEPGMKEQGDPWECEKLGEPATLKSGIDRCAWSGEDCIATKCCNDANMKCFQKDGYFAGCKFKPVDDWDNTVLGEFRGWHQVAEPAKAGEAKMGTKLYCIAVKSPNQRVEEATLLASAEERGIGIYSCNANSVFEGAVAAKTAWKSISNTDIFINVWNQVKAEGKFWNNDWTVKADPDCVFFGNRLQGHLDKLNLAEYSAVYIKNCDFKFRFQGSLEIFSEKAMEKYFEHATECSDKIGHEGGEDFYMMTCMDAMGVKTVEDDSILKDKYATGEHLILDDVSNCNDGWTAAFHPFRSNDVWNNCAQAATDAENAYAKANPEK